MAAHDARVDAAHGVQPVVARGRRARQLEQRAVVEHPRGRPVRAQGLTLPPGGQRAQRALAAAAQPRPALHSPVALLRRWAQRRRLGESLALLDDPGEAVALIEAAAQLAPDAPEVADVVERVRELLRRERAPQPLRVLRALVQPHVEHPLHERRVADLVAEADEGGGDLRIANRCAEDVEAACEQREVPLRGVGDRLDLRRADQLDERPRVDLEGIDGGDLRSLDVAPCDLHQREVRDVASLGHELEVERETARRADPRGDGLDLGVGSGERALHVSGYATTPRRTLCGLPPRTRGLRCDPGAAEPSSLATIRKDRRDASRTLLPPGQPRAGRDPWRRGAARPRLAAAGEPQRPRARRAACACWSSAGSPATGTPGRTTGTCRLPRAPRHRSSRCRPRARRPRSVTTVGPVWWWRRGGSNP